MINENLRLKDFPEEYLELPESSDVGYFPISRLQDGKMFKLNLKRLSEEIGIESLNVRPIQFTGNQLPSVNNEGDPLVKGDWTMLTAGETYTNINGGENIEAVLGKWSIAWFDGEKWIKKELADIPMQDLTLINKEIESINQSLKNLKDNFLAFYTDGEDLIDFIDKSGNVYMKVDQDSELYLSGLKDSVQTLLKRIPDNIFYSDDESIFFVVDKIGNIVFMIDQDSNLILSGMNESVQESIISLQGLIFEEDSENLMLVYDKNKNLILRIDTDSKYYIPLLSLSIQEEIISIKKGYPTNSKLVPNDLTDINTEVEKILNRRLLNGLSNFAIPYGTFRQNWDFNIEAIRTLTSSLVEEYVPISMPNGVVLNTNSGVVHPCITFFEFPVCGYKYWMTINGYPNESWEVTFLYGTNNDDLTGWKLIENAPTPFDPNPVLIPPYISSHGSDCFISYDPLTGQIIVGYRLTLRWHPSASTGQTNEVRYRTSFNGVSWSEQKVLNPPVTADIDLMQSTALVYDEINKQFIMIDCHPGQMKYKVTKDISDPYSWSEGVNIPNAPNMLPWHLEAKFVGKTLVLLVHENQNLALRNDKLWFCATNDMVNWVWSETDIFGGNSPMYKASFFPVFNNDGTMKFKIAYTTDENAPAGMQWRLKITETNSFNINA